MLAVIFAEVNLTRFLGKITRKVSYFVDGYIVLTNLF